MPVWPSGLERVFQSERWYTFTLETRPNTVVTFVTTGYLCSFYFQVVILHTVKKFSWVNTHAKHLIYYFRLAMKHIIKNIVPGQFLYVHLDSKLRSNPEKKNGFIDHLLLINPRVNFGTCKPDSRNLPRLSLTARLAIILNMLRSESHKGLFLSVPNRRWQERSTLVL